MKWVHEVVSEEHDDWISRLAVDDRGRYLASTSGHRAILIWKLDGAGCNLLRTVELPRSSFQLAELRFVPSSGQLIYVTDVVHVLDILTGQELYRINRKPSKLSVNAERGLVAFAFSSHEIEIWDLATREQTEAFYPEPLPDQVRMRGISAIAFGAGGAILASGANDKIIHLWDLTQPSPTGSTRQPALALSGHSVEPYELAFSPRGDLLYSTAEADRTFCWDPVNGREVWSSSGGSCLAVSPSGDKVAVGGPNPVHVFDASNGDTLQVLGHVGYLASIAFIPDGTAIVTGGNDRRIHFWREPISKRTTRYRLFDSEAWFSNLVRFFVELGFFRHLAGSPRSKSLQELLALYEREFRRTPPEKPSSELDHLRVLALDRERVWWEDLEADVSDTNKVYAAFLEDLASISAGHFRPSDVTEHWETSTGPIALSFVLRDERIQMHPEYRGDYIDIGLLRSLNPLLHTEPIRFEVFQPFDQTAFIVSLTSEQKQRLIKDLGWRFADYSH